MSKVQRGEKVYYITGFLPTNARKVCRFVFGDFFTKLILDEDNLQFIIILKKELNIDGKKCTPGDVADIEYFKDFWGPQWVLVYEKHDAINYEKVI